MNVFIGTSGWYYKDWHQAFYPSHLKKPDLLPFYAGQFPTVEINASFYRLLTKKTVADWTRKTPPDFLFAVKGSRFITHMKKLRDVGPGLEKFFDSIDGFGEKMGPILWQLPAILRLDLPRLESFLAELPKSMRHAVEFRHPSWLEEKSYEMLRRHDAAIVWVSSLAMPMHFTVTADFVFLRFHGLEGGARHDYTRAELEPWAEQIRRAARAGRPVFAFFNNDLQARAPENAKMLIEMVGRPAVRQPQGRGMSPRRASTPSHPEPTRRR